MHVVEGISDRVVALDHGVKLAEGTFDAVATDPRVVEAYLGTACDGAEMTESYERIAARCSVSTASIRTTDRCTSSRTCISRSARASSSASWAATHPGSRRLSRPSSGSSSPARAR